MSIERCDGCGFAWDEVPVVALVPRIRAGAAALAALVRRSPDVAGVRPISDRWSMLEYGGHVRDVMLMMRDRFVAAVVLDEPEFTPMFRDARVELRLYADDDPVTVAAELEMAAALLGRTLAAMAPGHFDRTCVYGYPEPRTRTLGWVGAQVVHEIEHHLGDARRDLTLLAD